MNTIGLIAAVIAFLLGVLLRHVIANQELRAEQRRWVKVGDVWEFIGPKSIERNRVFTVVKPNVNTEAGADSWEMRSIDGKTAYMHHRTRAKDWVLLLRDGRPMRNRSDVLRCLQEEMS